MTIEEFYCNYTVKDYELIRRFLCGVIANPPLETPMRDRLKAVELLLELDKKIEPKN